MSTSVSGVHGSRTRNRQQVIARHRDHGIREAVDLIQYLQRVAESSIDALIRKVYMDAIYDGLPIYKENLTSAIPKRVRMLHILCFRGACGGRVAYEAVPEASLAE